MNYIKILSAFYLNFISILSLLPVSHVHFTCAFHHLHFIIFTSSSAFHMSFIFISSKLYLHSNCIPFAFLLNYILVSYLCLLHLSCISPAFHLQLIFISSTFHLLSIKFSSAPHVYSIFIPSVIHSCFNAAHSPGYLSGFISNFLGAGHLSLDNSLGISCFQFMVFGMFGYNSRNDNPMMLLKLW